MPNFKPSKGFKMKPSSFKKEWSTNEAGYDVKTTRRKNLFGRERVVEKYYDPETGEKLGKKVDVARGEGDPRANKQKIKKVNPGLTQSGGVGKIRMSQNPWEAPSGKSNTDTESDTKSITKDNRAQHAFAIDDKNKQRDDDGNPVLNKYSVEYNKMETDADGKRINPRNGKKYSSLKEFEDEAESWWDSQAAKTSNDKLKKQDQEYGLDKDGNVRYSESPSKKRGYTMKRKRK